MIEQLCAKYGKFIVKMEDEVEYYTFPTLEELAKANEGELRELGFGYRAKYLVLAVKQIKMKGGKEWLNSLCEHESKDILEELVQLSGVGPKVADCVALFSMHQFDLVPVDTHVFQIAQRYLKHMEDMNLSKFFYPQIVQLFRDTFGPLSGWAHTILFAAELPVFQSLMSENGILIIKTKKKPRKPKKKGSELESSQNRKKTAGRTNKKGEKREEKPKKSRKITKKNSKKRKSDSETGVEQDKLIRVSLHKRRKNI